MRTSTLGMIFFLIAVCSSGIQAQQSMTPGFQFLGRGYDVLFGNLYDTSGNGDAGWREQIFQFTTNQGLKTPDNLWLVPDYTTSLLLSTCSVDQTETILNDSFDYQNSVSVGFDINLDLFGAAFQFGIDSKHVADTTISKESIYAQLESSCAVYQLNMNRYKTPNVSEEFFYGAQSLTDIYDEDTYMQFIQTFGTHYIGQLRLGGRWGWLIEMKRNSFQKMLDDSIDWQLGLQYAGKVKAGFNVNGSVDTKTVTIVTDSISHNFSYNIGGDYKPDSNEWMSSVRANPMPIFMTPLPIWDLFTTAHLPGISNLSGKKALLLNATLNFCGWLRQTVNPKINCTRPEPLPKPTPAKLDPNAVRAICVTNNGGYAMYWRLINTNRPSVHADTDTFAAGSTRCMDGLMVQAEQGEGLSCGIMIIAGVQDYPGCDEGNNYDPRSTLSANYVCWGSTMGPSCKFDGFSQ